MYRIFMSNKHDVGISVCKGLLIILMVVGHCGENVPYLIRNTIYLFHMPCFFIISGFLFKEQYLQDIKTFIKRKFKTLYLPFVKWGVIFFLLNSVFIKFNIYSHCFFTDYKEWGIKIFLMTRNEPLLSGFWFLRELLCSSIITILLLKIYTNLNISINFKTLSIAVLFFVLLAIGLNSFALKFPLISSKTFLATAYFIFGYILKIYNKKPSLLLTVTGIIILFIISSFYSGHIDIKKHIYIYFIVSLFGSYSFLYFSTYIKIGTKFLDYIGKNTLYILTFHLLSFKIVSLIIIIIHQLPMERLSDYPVINIQCYWILYSVIGIIFPLIMGELIKKINNYFYRLFYNNA